MKSEMIQTKSCSDCGGSGSGLEGLVFMDGRKLQKTKSSAGCWSFQSQSGNNSIDSKAQNCKHG